MFTLCSGFASALAATRGGILAGTVLALSLAGEAGCTNDPLSALDDETDGSDKTTGIGEGGTETAIGGGSDGADGSGADGPGAEGSGALPEEAALPCFVDEGIPAGDAIKVDIDPSRVSGVAPLSVFFDANGTTATATDRPLHELGYCWDFGDPASGTFDVTGLSKNSARGAMAGHVFEEPGTYKVQLSVRDTEGKVATRSTTIEVTDPEEVYAGDKTVCISGRGNFDGCPADATQVTSSQFNAMSGHIAPQRRILFRRGETFAGTRTRVNVSGPGTIGAFGEGQLPLITTSDVLLELSGPSEFALDDWRIMDLHVRGEGNDSHLIKFQGTGKQVLVLRVHTDSMGRGVTIDDNVVAVYISQYPDLTSSDQITIAETEMEDALGGYGHAHVYGAATRFLMLGNKFGNVTGSHATRLTFVQGAVVSHNDISEVDSPRLLIKLHAPKFQDSPVNKGKYSEKVIISDNRFASTGGHDWSLALGPQNSSSDERVRDIVVERNIFTPGPTNATLAMYVVASDVSIRNNVFLRGRTKLCVRVVQHPFSNDVQNIAVYNNTCWSDESPPVLLTVDDGISNVTAMNNIIGGPLGLQGTIMTVAGDTSNNVLTGSDDFVSSSPVEIGDVMLTAGNPAVDAGTQAPVWWDINHAARPMDGTLDAGALEYEQ